MLKNATIDKQLKIYASKDLDSELEMLILTWWCLRRWICLDTIGISHIWKHEILIIVFHLPISSWIVKPDSAVIDAYSGKLVS